MAPSIQPQPPSDRELYDQLRDSGMSHPDAVQAVESRRKMHRPATAPGAPSVRPDALSGIKETGMAPKTTSTVENLGFSASRGMTLGLDRWLAPAAAAAAEAVTGGDPVKTYKAAAEDWRTRSETARAERPQEAMAAEIIAGLAGPGIASGAKTLAGRMGAGAVAGGGAGAVSGAAMTEGGLKERATGAAVSGTAGAVIGALLPAAATGASRVIDVSGVRPKTSGTPPGTELRYSGPAMTIASREDRAADKFLQALFRGDKTPEDLSSEVAARVGREKPITPLEVGGENMRGLGEAVASVPGKGKQIISDALEARRGKPFRTEEGGAYPRIRDDIETGMGMQGGSTVQATEEILRRRSETASPLYEQAFSGGAVDDPRLATLLKRPSTQRALGYARDLAEEAGESLRIPDTGGPMELRTLHHIKLALDDAIAASKLDTSKGPTMRARMIETRNEIREILRGNEHYRQASDIWAGESALKDALEEGAASVTAKSTSAEDIRRTMQSLSGGEREMFRQGAINTLLASTADVADNANLARRLVGNPNQRDRLRAMFDNETEFETFLLKMADEDSFATTTNRVLGGSPTARRLAAQDDLGDTPTGQAMQQAVQNPTLTGLLTAPLRKTWDAGRRRYIESTAEELAPMLVAGATPDAMTFDQVLARLVAANERVGRSAARAGAAGRATGQQAGSFFGDRNRKKPKQ